MKKLVLALLIVGLSVFIISSLMKWQAAEKAEPRNDRAPARITN
jgi:hypothetical protein